MLPLRPPSPLSSRLFLLLLAIAPWPLGSNRPWAWEPLALGLAGIAIMTGRQRDSGPPLPWWLATAVAGVALVIAWAVIQSLDPAPFLALADTLWPGSLPEWPLHPGLELRRILPAEILADAPAETLSLVPSASRDMAARLALYLMAFLLAWRQGASRTFTRQLFSLLAVVATTGAVLGLANLLTGSELLWWREKWAYRGVLTASFVNRNAAASMLTMGMLAALLRCRRSWRVARQRHSSAGHLATGERITASEGTTDEDSLPARLKGGPGWAIAAILCAIAILATHSRAGSLSAVLALLLWAGYEALSRLPRLSSRARATASHPESPASAGRAARWFGRAVIAAIFLALLAAAAPAVLQRWAATSLDHNDRLAIHEAIVASLTAPGQRHWLYGHGAGSFDRAFMAWRPQELVQHWNLAHSSFLENAFELGVPAASLLYLSCALVVAGALWPAPARPGQNRTERSLRYSGSNRYSGNDRRHRHADYPALVLALAGAALVHGSVDFTWQHPANALWLMAMLGTATARCQQRRQQEHHQETRA